MSNNIYGGDEVNSVVVDLGSHSCKAGYAGDDTPKAVFPSVACQFMDGGPAATEVDGGKHSGRRLSVGHQALSCKLQGAEVVSPFGADDLYSDWDVLEALHAHALRDRLNVKPEEFALMLAEPTHNTRTCREKLVEMVFETFQAPALFLAKNAVLSAFASARQTALVVDSGYRATTAAAVQDGYVLNRTVTRTPLGGQLLNHAVQAVATAKFQPLRPRFSVRREEVRPGEFTVRTLDTEGVTPSFSAYHVEQLASDIKESVGRTGELRYIEGDTSNMTPVTYELPDGQELHLCPERYKVPELLFQPSLAFPGLAAPAGAKPLPDTVLDAINKCDVDVRKDMYAGAILTGGTSLLGGLRERLEKEMGEMIPPAVKVKVVAPSNQVERRFSVWIGGSILASLGSFQQLWMSKKEYAEHGAPLINRKCP